MDGETGGRGDWGKRKAVFTWCFILLVSVILIAGAFHFDNPLRRHIVQSQGSDWKSTPEYQVASKVSRYGDWPQIMVFGIIGTTIAWRLRSPNWSRILIAAILASSIAGIIASSSRVTTGRTRPRESPAIHQGFYGPWHNGELLVGNSKYNAFPSGHTATAVGFAAVILFAKPFAGIFAMVIAFAIAWSRVALGAHHLSDVVVSTILGLIVAWLIWQWIQKYGDQTAQRILQRWNAKRGTNQR